MRTMRHLFTNLCRRLMLPLLAAVFLIWLVPPVTPMVHADGGAPNLAYVAGTQQGVSVIDVGQQKVTLSLPVPGDPHSILLSLDARFLYATQPQLGKVAVIAAKTGQPICSANVPGQPTLLAVDTGSGTLYAAGNGDSSVSAIDPTSCAIKHTFQADGPIYGLAVANVASSNAANSGNQLWVSAGNALLVFDDNSGQKITSIPIAGGPGYITIPPGTAAYVTLRAGGFVAVGLDQHQVIPLLTQGSYGPMDFDETTGEVYVPDQQNAQLVVITPINPGAVLPHEPNRMVKFAAMPLSVAITSDGQLGFVALQDGHVAMLDIPGRQIITTYNVGGNPHFIITGLYPPAIGTTPQQANILGTIINIAAYIFVFMLLLVPILLFRRFTKARAAEEAAKTDLKEEKEEKVVQQEESSTPQE